MTHTQYVVPCTFVDLAAVEETWTCSRTQLGPSEVADFLEDSEAIFIDSLLYIIHTFSITMMPYSCVKWYTYKLRQP